ncbi:MULTISPECIES: hypothetical protein [unclassified Amycolatopsis]|uniref:hypothetical protein n=1 Tax=unclassified Amycolatopsis TaxID=2618356 RepID=UPI001C69CC64|nr:hypothetical protein [Amycolatopsis sp. DSM 110486]QYN17304.1 hypothetical protein K1T34_31335 [Amycolatopsis sp. DSM 110486]
MGIRLWRWLAPVLVAALGAGVGLAFVVGMAVRPDPLPIDRTPVPLAAHQLCRDVQAYFDTDEQMRRAAGSFHDDPDARLVFVETKHESFLSLRDGFKDHPEILNGLGGEESSPAVVTVVPPPATDLVAYTARLKTRFPDAQEVYSLDVNAFNEKFGKPRDAPTCPRAGEY